MSKKVLVTGATGFLGGSLSRYLLSKGYLVTGLGRNLKKVEDLKKEGIPSFSIDLSVPNSLARLGRTFDIIVHCAAKSSPWGFKDEFIDQNVKATKHVFDFALDKGIKKVIHISTPSIYFEFKDRFKVKEEDPLPKQMVNLYAQTKLEAESVVKSYREKGIDSILIRPRAIIGKGDTVIFPRIIRAYKEGRLKQMSSTNPLMDVTNIDNLVYAIELTINANQDAYNRTYNICNGDPIPFWDLIRLIFKELKYPLELKSVPYPIAYGAAAMSEMLASITKNEPTLTKYSVGIIRYSLTMSIKKAKKYLKYEPPTSTKEALSGFVEWWKKQDNG